MDRKQLKEQGKKVFYKKYWYCVIVTFLMLLAGGSGGSLSFNIGGSGEFNVNFNEGFNQGFNEGYNMGINGSINNFFDFLATPIVIAVFAFVFIAVIVASVLSILIFSSFRCGGIRFFLKLRKNQGAEINEVFENLKDKTFFNIAKVTFFKKLSIFLWSLLFVIPGIIKSYEYWAVDYILAVRPDINQEDAFRLSKTVMDGHKLEIWVLELSFLGWDFLSILSGTLVGIFFVNPYKQATFVEFFSQIRLEAIKNGKIAPYDIPDYEFTEPQPQYQNPYQNQYYQSPVINNRPNNIDIINQTHLPQEVGFEHTMPKNNNTPQPTEQNDKQN